MTPRQPNETAARRTRNQNIVLDVLAKAGRPLSAYQILDQTSSEGVRAPQQVYRALEGLQHDHLVHRIETLNAYQICQHGPHRHQAAFAICRDCGVTREFPLARLDQLLDLAAGEIGFHIEAANVELTGWCGACAAARTAVPQKSIDVKY